MDKDLDGYITLDELIAFLQKSGSTLTESEIQDKFTEFDTDQDGKLNPMEAIELRNTLMGSEELSKIFSTFVPIHEFIYKLDTDKDGKISYEEFKQPLINLGSSTRRVLTGNPFGVLRVSEKVFEEAKQSGEYRSINDFYPIPFMHFCMEIYLRTNPNW